MAFDVFISYPGEERSAAFAACAVLESHRVRCWIAPRDIVPGRNWGEAIVDAIAEAKLMVLIFSDHANKSPQITRELERAVNRSMPIIPFRVEDVTPSKSLEFFISSQHWLDAFTPPLEQHLDKLAISVRALLNSAAGEPAPDIRVSGARALSQIRQQFLAAKSLQDLKRAQYALEAFLETDRRNVDAQMLHDQITQAIAYESAPAAAPATMPRAPHEAAPRSVASRRRLAGVAAAFVVMIFSGALYYQLLPHAALPPSPAPPELFRTLAGHAGPVDSVAFSPDGAWIASGSSDGTVKLWAIADRAVVRTFMGHSGRSILFSPDGAFIASAGGGERDAPATINLWSTSTGQLLSQFTQSSRTLALAMTPDGRSILSGHEDGTTTLWDISSGREILRLTGASAVLSVAFSPDGTRFATGGLDRTITLWHAPGGRLSSSFEVPNSSAQSLVFSPDGRVMASAGKEGVKLWDVVAALKTLATLTAPASAVAFSPDGRSIASAGQDGTVRVLQAETLQEVKAFVADTGLVDAVAFSPDGKWIASGGQDTLVKLWPAP